MTTGLNEDNLWDSRTRRLIGEARVKRLADAHVCVVGAGGVGGYAIETLARTGVGHLTLIDADEVNTSNLNRQIIALHSTLGHSKVRAFAERCHDINPDIEIICHNQFLTPDNVGVLVAKPDYVIDAIDTVAPKVALLAYCLQNRIPVISSMGAGGRTDASRIVYADLWETRDDGLARAVRQRFKKMGLRRPLRVVASTEPPQSASLMEIGTQNKRSSYGTVMAVPAIFGIYLAQAVINKFL